MFLQKSQDYFQYSECENCNGMNESDVIKIFEILQQPSQSKSPIHPNRKLKPSSKFLSLLCCSSAARDYSYEPNDFYRILLYLNLIYDHIEYNIDEIEFLTEPSLIFCLLHEEGHMRYWLDKIDWDDKKIDILPKDSAESWRENEFKADRYAARIMLKIFPEYDPCKTIEMLFLTNQNCRKKHKICWLRRKIHKHLNKQYFGFEDYHPSNEDRINKIKEYCAERNNLSST